MPKPIVKWAGGKSSLLDELRARIPAEVRTYAEPFAGGAALFFDLAGRRDAKTPPSERRHFDRAVLCDQNEDLVATYRAVRDELPALITRLARYTNDRDLFYETRALDPRGMSDVERGARLIFLNKTCYNGLWRVNQGGRFNVPFGRYKSPRILDEERLSAASAALQGVEVSVSDFATVTRSLGPGDFVYLDPPYAPLTRTANFTSYASGGFGVADHERLATELADLGKRGAMGMLSNADTPTMRELYRDHGFTVHVVHAPRAINSDGAKRGEASELLVTSWPTAPSARAS